MRILFADGDTAFLAVTQRYMSQHGHHAETASNGLECVACLQRAVPDVVILERDMLWGGGDGVRAVMHQDPRWQKVPVIMISDNGFIDGFSTCAGLPLAAQLRKPYRLEELLGHLQACSRDYAPESA